MRAARGNADHYARRTSGALLAALTILVASVGGATCQTPVEVGVVPQDVAPPASRKAPGPEGTRASGTFGAEDEDVDRDGDVRAASLHARRLAVLEGAAGQLRVVERAGGWDAVGGGESLRLGSAGPEVSRLRRRLEQSGDLPARGMSGEAFDPALDAAVRGFQRRHGLEVDGIVGPATRRALDVPVGTRIRQVEAAIGAWRALPADLGRRSIVVNVPAFELEALEDEGVALRIRTVVGRVDRPTPPMTSSVDAVALSPYWNVPPGIARLDVLPAIRRDPDYLRRNRMRVLTPDGRPLDAGGIVWSTVSEREIRIRQEPGAGNPMGRVKILFPNDRNVFLHDTPDPHLFDRTVRAFSSACIRVERALDLTEWLLKGDSAWDRKRIDVVAEGGREVWVAVRPRVPIHLVYLTAWVDEAGTLQFRHDLYGRHGFP